MHAEPDFVPSLGAATPWQPQPPQRLGTQTSLQKTFDCVVVGAGFTGLACAHRLAALRPEWTIAVIDAMRVGQSASGRNSGFIMDIGHWHAEWDLDVNLAVGKLSEYGIGLLRAIVESREIECAWNDGDRYHVAVNRRGHRALEAFEAGMKQMGYPLTEVDPDEFAARIGTRHYNRALQTNGGALVNPAQLIRGIAAALPESVTLVEEQPVTELQPGSRHRVVMDSQAVHAEHLVLATNGFMGAFGVGDSRVLPFATYASATEPLDELPGTHAQWGLVPEELMGSTLRLTADRRILIRNGVALTSPPKVDDAQVLRAARQHRESFVRRFPQLEHVSFSHSWGGVLGVSNNGGTVFGSFGDRAWVAGAHNGVGMAQGTAMGDLLAHRIAGHSHPLHKSVARLPEPSWVPPQPILGLGVKLYTGLLAALAGEEK